MTLAANLPPYRWTEINCLVMANTQAPDRMIADQIQFDERMTAAGAHEFNRPRKAIILEYIANPGLGPSRAFLTGLDRQ